MLANGSYPVIIRLANHSKNVSVPTGVRVYTNEWDGIKCKVIKLHLTPSKLNLKLTQQLMALEKRLINVPDAGSYPNCSKQIQ